MSTAPNVINQKPQPMEMFDHPSIGNENESDYHNSQSLSLADVPDEFGMSIGSEERFDPMDMRDSKGMDINIPTEDGGSCMTQGPNFSNTHSVTDYRTGSSKKSPPVGQSGYVK